MKQRYVCFVGGYTFLPVHSDAALERLIRAELAKERARPGQPILSVWDEDTQTKRRHYVRTVYAPSAPSKKREGDA